MKAEAGRPESRRNDIRNEKENDHEIPMHLQTRQPRRNAAFARDDGPRIASTILEEIGATDQCRKSRLSCGLTRKPKKPRIFMPRFSRIPKSKWSLAIVTPAPALKA